MTFKRRTSMATMLAVLTAAFVWLCAPALASSRAGAKLTGAQSLGGALQPNGTLRRHVQGSFSPRGYRLVLGKGGAPRFVKSGANVSSSALSSSASTSSPSDSFWSENFGAVGLPNAMTFHAVAVSGANVYVGGAFTTISAYSGLVYNNVAWWDGHGWRALGTGTNGAVDAIAVSGSNLYVGGSFTSAGGAPANRIARWNGSGWSGLGGGMTNTTSGGTPVVNAIAISGSNVYAGGLFDDAGTAVAHSVAMWNGTQWSALDTGVLECGFFNVANHCWTTPTNGTVKALLVRGSTLYAGGSFNFASGRESYSLAAWNGTSWAPVGGAGVSYGGNPGNVTSLAASSTTLYVGGQFDHVGGTISSGGGWSGGLAVSSVAALTGATWSALGGGANTGVPLVTGLAYWNGKLFMSGTITGAGGDNSPIIGQWNGTAWSALGPGLDGGSSVSAVLASGTGGVYALGGFSYGGGHTIVLNHIGLWNGSAWQGLGLGVGDGAAVGAVNALAAANHNLYAAGAFNVAGWGNIRALAHFNGTKWLPMGTGVNGSVDAIAVWGNDVFVGGSFSQAGGVPASNIAMWNGSSWFALGGGTDGTVNALLVYKGKLWVGGAFQNADSKSAIAVATWTPTSAGATTGTWAPVGGNIDYVQNGGYGVVNALSGLVDPTNSANNHYLAIGGSFQQVDDLTTAYDANNVVLFDTNATITGPFSGYYTLGPGSSPGVTGGSGLVKALYFLGSTLYVGGNFTQAGTTSASNFASIAVFGPNGWTSPGAVNNTVWALTGYNRAVYLAGGFTSAGGQAANYVAQYTPAANRWAPLGSGLGYVNPYEVRSPIAESLAQSAYGLYVGGQISLAAGKPSNSLALWTGTAIPTVSETVSPTSTTVGSPVTFKATITNPSSASAPGVTLTSTLPSSATFVSATPSQGTCTNNSGKLSCSLGLLAGGGGTATVAITLTPNATGSLSDSVTVAESGFSNSASAAAKVN